MVNQCRIAVFGGRDISPELYDQTLEIGKLLGAEGWLVYCGGGPGVMEAIARGVHDSGGTTVGILKSSDITEANDWITIPVVTGLGITRNAVLARNCDVAVAIGGKYGTLSEIAFAHQLGKPVVGFNTWDLTDVIQAENPVDLISKIKENL